MQNNAENEDSDGDNEAIGTKLTSFTKLTGNKLRDDGKVKTKALQIFAD